VKFAEARAKALEHGATDADIEREAQHQRRHVGTVPFNNMIRALTLPVSSFLNDREDWTRLAAALKARKESRR
jgi:hypothetical protein